MSNTTLRNDSIHFFVWSENNCVAQTADWVLSFLFWASISLFYLYRVFLPVPGSHIVNWNSNHLSRPPLLFFSSASEPHRVEYLHGGWNYRCLQRQCPFEFVRHLTRYQQNENLIYSGFTATFINSRNPAPYIGIVKSPVVLHLSAA